MALRTVRNILCLSKFFRNHSTTAPLVGLTINEKTGVATATLQRPPVNSLNLELTSKLSKIFQDLEKEKCKGLILTSGTKGVFCAGFDIEEMYKPNINSLKQGWAVFVQLWVSLHGSSFPTAAVINGHATAGGCILALSCEYRIMLNNFKIGLNETQLGLPVPSWLIGPVTKVIGSRQSELALTTGTLFKTDEALMIGLVDEAVATEEEGLEKAETFMQRFEKVSPYARSLTKKSLRDDDTETLLNTKEEEFINFARVITSPQGQKSIEKYWKALKQK